MRKIEYNEPDYIVGSEYYFNPTVPSDKDTSRAFDLPLESAQQPLEDKLTLLVQHCAEVCSNSKVDNSGIKPSTATCRSQCRKKPPIVLVDLTQEASTQEKHKKPAEKANPCTGASANDVFGDCKYLTETVTGVDEQSSTWISSENDQGWKITEVRGEASDVYNCQDGTSENQTNDQNLDQSEVIIIDSAIHALERCKSSINVALMNNGTVPSSTEEKDQNLDVLPQDGDLESNTIAELSMSKSDKRILEPLFQRLSEVERITDTVSVKPAKVKEQIASPNDHNCKTVVSSEGTQTEGTLAVLDETCGKKKTNNSATKEVKTKSSSRMPCLVETKLQSPPSDQSKRLNISYSPRWMLHKLDIEKPKEKGCRRGIHGCVCNQNKNGDQASDKNKSVKHSASHDLVHRQSPKNQQVSEMAEITELESASLPIKNNSSSNNNNCELKSVSIEPAASFNRAPKKFFQSKHNAMESLKEEKQQQIVKDSNKQVVNEQAKQSVNERSKEESDSKSKISDTQSHDPNHKLISLSTDTRQKKNRDEVRKQPSVEKSKTDSKHKHSSSKDCSSCIPQIKRNKLQDVPTERSTSVSATSRVVNTKGSETKKNEKYSKSDSKEPSSNGSVKVKDDVKQHNSSEADKCLNSKKVSAKPPQRNVLDISNKDNVANNSTVSQKTCVVPSYRRNSFEVMEELKMNADILALDENQDHVLNEVQHLHEVAEPEKLTGQKRRNSAEKRTARKKSDPKLEIIETPNRDGIHLKSVNKECKELQRTQKKSENLISEVTSRTDSQKEPAASKVGASEEPSKSKDDDKKKCKAELNEIRLNTWRESIKRLDTDVLKKESNQKKRNKSDSDTMQLTQRDSGTSKLKSESSQPRRTKELKELPAMPGSAKHKLTKDKKPLKKNTKDKAPKGHLFKQAKSLCASVQQRRNSTAGSRSVASTSKSSSPRSLKESKHSGQNSSSASPASSAEDCSINQPISSSVKAPSNTISHRKRHSNCSVQDEETEKKMKLSPKKTDEKLQSGLVTLNELSNEEETKQVNRLPQNNIVSQTNSAMEAVVIPLPDIKSTKKQTKNLLASQSCLPLQSSFVAASNVSQDKHDSKKAKKVTTSRRNPLHVDDDETTVKKARKSPKLQSPKLHTESTSQVKSKDCGTSSVDSDQTDSNEMDYLLQVSDISSEDDSLSNSSSKKRKDNLSKDKGICATKSTEPDLFYSFQLKRDYQSQGKRLAQEIPGFNWLEEKIKNGDLGANSNRKKDQQPAATSSIRPQPRQLTVTTNAREGEIESNRKMVVTKEQATHVHVAAAPLPSTQSEPVQKKQCQKVDMVQEALNASGVQLSSTLSSFSSPLPANDFPVQNVNLPKIIMQPHATHDGQPPVGSNPPAKLIDQPLVDSNSPSKPSDQLSASSNSPATAIVQQTVSSNISPIPVAKLPVGSNIAPVAIAQLPVGNQPPSIDQPPIDYNPFTGSPHVVNNLPPASISQTHLGSNPPLTFKQPLMGSNLPSMSIGTTNVINIISNAHSHHLQPTPAKLPAAMQVMPIAQPAEQSQSLDLSRTTCLQPTSVNVSIFQSYFSEHPPPPLLPAGVTSTAQTSSMPSTAISSSTTDKTSVLRSVLMDSNLTVKDVDSNSLPNAAVKRLSTSQLICERIKCAQPINSTVPLTVRKEPQSLPSSVNTITTTTTTTPVSVPNQVSVICTPLFNDEDEKILSNAKLRAANCTGDTPCSNIHKQSTNNATSISIPASRSRESYDIREQITLYHGSETSKQDVGFRVSNALTITQVQHPTPVSQSVTITAIDSNGYQQNTMSHSIPVNTNRPPVSSLEYLAATAKPGNIVMPTRTDMMPMQNLQSLSASKSDARMNAVVAPCVGKVAQDVVPLCAVDVNQKMMSHHSSRSNKLNRRISQSPQDRVRISPVNNSDARMNVIVPQCAASPNNRNSVVNYPHQVPTHLPPVSTSLPCNSALTQSNGRSPVSHLYSNRGVDQVVAKTTNSHGRGHLTSPQSSSTTRTSLVDAGRNTNGQYFPMHSLSAPPSASSYVNDQTLQCQPTRQEVWNAAAAHIALTNRDKHHLDIELERGKKELEYLEGLAQAQEMERKRILEIKRATEAQMLKIVEMKNMQDFGTTHNGNSQPEPAKTKHLVSSAKSLKKRPSAEVQSSGFEKISATTTERPGNVHPMVPSSNDYLQPSNVPASAHRANTQMPRFDLINGSYYSSLPNDNFGNSQYIHGSLPPNPQPTSQSSDSSIPLRHDFSSYSHMEHSHTKEKCPTCTAVGFPDGCLIQKESGGYPGTNHAHPLHARNPVHFARGEISRAVPSATNGDSGTAFYSGGSAWNGNLSQNVPPSNPLFNLLSSQTTNPKPLPVQPTPVTRPSVGFHPVVPNANPFERQLSNHALAAPLHQPVPQNYHQHYRPETRPMASNAAQANLMLPYQKMYEMSDKRVATAEQKSTAGLEHGIQRLTRMVTNAPLQNYHAAKVDNALHDSRMWPPVSREYPMGISAEHNPPSIGSCFSCRQTARFMCSRCNSIQYCSQDCQMTDWSRHAKYCGNPPAKADHT